MIFTDTNVHARKLVVLEQKLQLIQDELRDHSVYSRLFNKQNMRTFMEYHVFAVWDFMTILKAMQNKLTCTTIPWKPSTYPKEMTRFINEIVLDEESDLDHNGQACDHFSMYVRAMDEIKANTRPIRTFLHKFDIDILTSPLKEFIQFNMNVARSYPLHILAGVFFYGREKVIPKMFKSLLDGIESSSWIHDTPSLHHYFKRHIELDGDEHGPIAEKLLQDLCNDDPKLMQEAISFGLQACLLRKKLYDRILQEIDNSTITLPPEKIQ